MDGCEDYLNKLRDVRCLEECLALRKLLLLFIREIFQNIDVLMKWNPSHAHLIH